MAKTNKPVVQYRPSPYQSIVVGQSAFVVSVDHPDTENVTNGQHAMTSEVISFDEATGTFETKNTKYVVEKQQEAAPATEVKEETKTDVAQSE